MRLGRNDPCHCGSGKKYKRCHLDPDEAAKGPKERPTSIAETVASLPDRRPLKGIMTQVLDTLGGQGERPRSAAETAQAIMDEAWEQSNAEQRIAMAQEALEVSPDCADAYVLLAEETARTNTERAALYEQGVAAGERALGKQAFEEHAGHFWDVFETRPYMRALHCLAQCQWHLGDRDAAISHFEGLLRLNPNDNQGVRYQLAACLEVTGREEALGDLLTRYERDRSAVWAYSAALLAFKRGGDTEPARDSLSLAYEVNPNVPAYLLGEKKLPQRLPRYVGFSDEPEAVAYAAEHAGTWAAAPGALDWLRAQTKDRSL